MRTDSSLKHARNSLLTAWLMTFTTSAVLFAVTDHSSRLRVNDTDATNWPAWWFVRHGTFFMDGFHSGNPWFVHAAGHLVSDRMGGAILFGLPMQALLSPLHVSPTAAGALTASLATAFAMANIAVVFRRLGTGVRLTFAVTAVLAFGTGMWTVSSAELWTHTANVFWLSCALLALTYSRTLLAGILIAPVIPTRPHLVVVIALLGLWLGVQRRSPRVLLHFAIPALGALAGLLVWNHHMYGSWTIGGGYAGHEDALTGTGAAIWPFIRDVAGTVGSPLRGVLLYTPVIVVALLCVPAGWRRAPDWARAGFVGGVLYELVQLRLNRYSGGTSFYSNRLVLELFLLAAPLIVLGYQEWREGGPHRATLTRGLASTSVSIHALGAFLPNAYFAHLQHWTTWGPIAAIRYVTDPAVALLVVAVTISVIVTLWPLRGQTIAWPVRRRPPTNETASQPEPALATR